ncbi:MAG TPA: hypothetical protein VN428_25395 [Bryobacteraceae bacterium]|nr:hypothetical protein [Bryobacteraceae bacterium]
MDSENTAIFDSKRTIALKLNTPEGAKTVRVRFPSDDEWTARQRRRKVIVKNLGRGMSETSVAGSEEIDAALIAKIRVEPEAPVEIDPFEATRIIEQLSQAEVDDVVSADAAFRVSTRVLGGTTTHLLKMPSAKDVIEYRRGFLRSVDLPYGKQEITVNLAAAGTLYMRLCEATEGYSGPVPIVHQAVAVKAAIDALDIAFQEDRDANF